MKEKPTYIPERLHEVEGEPDLSQVFAGYTEFENPDWLNTIERRRNETTAQKVRNELGRGGSQSEIALRLGVRD